MKKATKAKIVYNFIAKQQILSKIAKKGEISEFAKF